ncbi:MAG: MarR family transcriptional regulator [Anaerovibrio sp.]|uniref:MarR family transcriptional regulator n=1 Tax=Anaerovibrio sp. TaxID=1872532 RepID=UPI0025CEF126|nr:MarR family transcriptional regulator [Anaerovibrio sp.]MCR5175420.1 MarR family transcriptional regulator [Anaerovibrio sp.]
MDYLGASINFGIIRRRVQSLVVEATSDLGLTYSEFSFMVMLFDKEGCSQDDMTVYLHVDKAAITRVIKTLESKKMIYRRRDTSDRRLKRLFLTQEARQLEPGIKNIIEKIVDFMAKDFSDQDCQFMLDGVNTMAQRLKTADFKAVFEKREVEVL